MSFPNGKEPKKEILLLDKGVYVPRRAFTSCLNTFYLCVWKAGSYCPEGATNDDCKWVEKYPSFLTPHVRHMLLFPSGSSCPSEVSPTCSMGQSISAAPYPVPGKLPTSLLVMLGGTSQGSPSLSWLDSDHQRLSCR